MIIEDILARPTVDLGLNAPKHSKTSLKEKPIQFKSLTFDRIPLKEILIKLFEHLNTDFNIWCIMYLNRRNLPSLKDCPCKHVLIVFFRKYGTDDVTCWKNKYHKKKNYRKTMCFSSTIEKPYEKITFSLKEREERGCKFFNVTSTSVVRIRRFCNVT